MAGEPSEVQVANVALQLVGAKRIVSLSEDTVSARAVRDCFYTCRDELLEMYDWSHAIKRVTLAAEVTAPEFTKATAYTLPSDFMRLLLQDPETEFEGRDWVVEDGMLLTNETGDLDLRYIFKQTDPASMPALFRKAWSTSMALNMVDLLTQSNSKKAALEGMHEKAIADATASNAIQKRPKQFTEDTWVTARST